MYAPSLCYPLVWAGGVRVIERCYSLCYLQCEDWNASVALSEPASRPMNKSVWEPGGQPGPCCQHQRKNLLLLLLLRTQHQGRGQRKGIISCYPVSAGENKVAWEKDFSTINSIIHM